MIDLTRAKEHIRVDIDEDNGYITDLITVSEIYIESMVGVEYKADEKLVKLAEILQLKLISDMYDNRSMYIPNNISRDRIVGSILDKLAI